MNLKKYIKQSLIYLIEISLIIFVFNYILSYFFPVENYFDYFSRSLGIYTIYQLFVYSTLKLAADAQTDAYSTLKSMNEQALLNIKYFRNDPVAYFFSSLMLKNHLSLINRKFQLSFLLRCIKNLSPPHVKQYQNRYNTEKNNEHNKN